MQQTVKCPNCGTPNVAGQKFCGSCGSQLGVACPNCGAMLDAGDRFCGNCGAQMPSQIPHQQSPYQQQPPQSPYNPQQRSQQWNAQQGMYGPPQSGMPYQGAYGAAAPRKQSSMPLLILLVVLILVLGGFAYWSFVMSPWAGGGSSTVQIQTGPFIQATTDNTSSTRDVTITWETNTPTIGQVEYGADTSYGSTSQLESGETKNHSIPLTGLTPETRYHYRVLNSKNGNTTTSSDYTFTTPQ